MAMSMPTPPPRVFNGIFTNPISAEAIANSSSVGSYDLRMMIYEIDSRLDGVLAALNQIQQRTNAVPGVVSVAPLNGVSRGFYIPVNGYRAPMSTNLLYNTVRDDLESVSAALLTLSSHLDKMAGVVQGIDRALTPLGKLQAASTIRNKGFLPY